MYPCIPLVNAARCAFAFSSCDGPVALPEAAANAPSVAIAPAIRTFDYRQIELLEGPMPSSLIPTTSSFCSSTTTGFSSHFASVLA